jgi:hypothetical protein
MEIVLEPDLSRCIETTAREEFQRGVQALAAGEEDEALAERTESLRLFLESADFMELRRISEPLLAEGRRVTFFVLSEGDAVRWHMDVADTGITGDAGADSGRFV